jgi:hypothetical protein
MDNTGIIGPQHSSLPARAQLLSREAVAFISALFLISFASAILLALQQFGYTETWPFAFLMMPPSYLCGRAIIRSLYDGDVRPASLIGLSSIIWYFAPLSVLALQIPGATLSLDPADIPTASIRLLIALALLIPVMILERRAAFSLVEALDSAPNSIIFMLLGSAALIEIILITTGSWTYGALLLASDRLTGTQEGPSTAALQLVNYCAVITTPMAAFYYGRSLSMRAPRHVRWVALTALLVGLAWHFVGGRRYVAVELVMSSTMYLSARYRLLGTRVSWSAVSRVGLAAVCAIALMWPAYFAMRVASYSVRDGQKMPSITELLSSAGEMDSSDLDQGLSEKVVDRSAIITSYSLVTSYLRGFAGGEGLAHAALMSLPPMVFPGDKLAYSSEIPSVEVIWRKYGVPANDYANSLPLDSYVDFGVIGLAIYTLLIELLVLLCCLLFRRARFICAGICLGYVYLFLNAEGGIQTYFANLRPAFIVALLTMALLSLTRIFRKRYRNFDDGATLAESEE